MNKRSTDFAALHATTLVPGAGAVQGLVCEMRGLLLGAVALPVLIQFSQDMRSAIVQAASTPQPSASFFSCRHHQHGWRKSSLTFNTHARRTLSTLTPSQHTTLPLTIASSSAKGLPHHVCRSRTQSQPIANRGGRGRRFDAVNLRRALLASSGGRQRDGPGGRKMAILSPPPRLFFALDRSR